MFDSYIFGSIWPIYDTEVRSRPDRRGLDAGDLVFQNSCAQRTDRGNLTYTRDTRVVASRTDKCRKEAGYR